MTPRLLLVTALFVAAMSAPMHAQVVVFDPANIAKAILIAERTLREWETMVKQLQIVTAMSQKLQGIEKYRTTALPGASHDVSAFPYGGQFLQAFESGDARGDIYRTVLPPVAALPAAVDALPPAARQIIRNQAASIEIADSVAQRAIHQRALISTFSALELGPALAALQDLVTHPRTAYHYMTATLDKIAGGELIGRRQDTAQNQLLSHALEQLLVRTKRQRDTEAATMNMRITGMTPAPSVIEGASDDLRNWRQP